jgi:hypothetical protein
MTTTLGSGEMRVSNDPPPATEPLPVLRAVQLENRWPQFGPLFNPSVFIRAGAPWVIARTQIDKFTRNLIGPLDGWPHDASELRDNRHTVSGFEDCRAVVIDGVIKIVASVISRRVTSGIPPIRIALADVVEDRGRLTIGTARIVESKNPEKNWMPVVTTAGLRLIYSVDPLTVLDPNNLPLALVSKLPVPRTYRGSSQLVAWRNGWLAIIHQTYQRANAPKPVYLHRFVTFDREIESRKISPPFHFHAQGVEFCAGLAERAGKLLVSYGVNDKEAWVAEVDPAVVDALPMTEVGS